MRVHQMEIPLDHDKSTTRCKVQMGKDQQMKYLEGVWRYRLVGTRKCGAQNLHREKCSRHLTWSKMEIKEGSNVCRGLNLLVISPYGRARTEQGPYNTAASGV